MQSYCSSVDADHRCFDHVAYTHIDNQRNHAAEGKVDLAYWLVGLGDFITKDQLYAL
jgi:hypothetical protein